MGNIILESAKWKIKANPKLSLFHAMVESHAFKLNVGQWAQMALARVVPRREWHNTKGADAIAALELANRS